MDEIRELIKSIFKDTFLEEDAMFVEEDIPQLLDEMNIPFSYTYASGASKFVLIPESLDFVIKVPFTGMLTMSGYYEQYKYAEGYYPWDYCGSEESRYIQAVEDGYGKFFAKTEQIIEKDGFPIYIQEKCIPLTLSFSRKHYSKEEKRKTWELTNFSYIDIDWLTECRTLYGDEVIKDFVDYLDFNLWNDDLRMENIGYLNGKPVLIDYSSFGEDC